MPLYNGIYRKVEGGEEGGSLSGLNQIAQGNIKWQEGLLFRGWAEQGLMLQKQHFQNFAIEKGKYYFYMFISCNNKEH